MLLVVALGVPCSVGASVAAVARAHEVVIHGNGPQVALLALRSEAAGGSPPMPGALIVVARGHWFETGIAH